MRYLLCIVLSLWHIIAGAAPAGSSFADLVVLCYHDVREGPGQPNDLYTIDSAQLINEFAWLKENGYTPVSVRQIVEARDGRKPLPPKPVLITFDDGYRSFYTHVFPLLRLFQYPALFSLVGRWIEDPAQGSSSAPAKSKLVSWDEVRVMAQSGLVEIGSHSYDLHQGIRSNPQGNEFPAATTRPYDPLTDRYETDATYASRIHADLMRNSSLIEKHTGIRPRAMVWPYGNYNETAQHIARDLGMDVSIGLDHRHHVITTSDIHLGRILIEGSPDLRQFVETLVQPYKPNPVRAVQIDLDYIYDADPARQEANLSRLLDRIKDMGVNTVYLQAYADPDGDGVADALYFPSRHMPMRADLFGRVSWQLRTRTGVQVFAWMPLLAFKLPDGHPRANNLVTSANGAKGRYRRLSPFDQDARRVILDIYEDLARQAQFAGLLFHDDATLDDYEDASAPAMAYYRTQWGLNANMYALRTDPALLKKWTPLKTAHLIAFTQEIVRAVSKYRAPLLTARNLYAQPLLNLASEAWYAQSYSAFSQSYDQVVVMAMPYLEGAFHAGDWLKDLARASTAQPSGRAKVVFELQTRDWKKGRAISSDTLAKMMNQLQLLGIAHLAYYPDDFVHDQPALRTIRPFMSLQGSPR